MDRIIESLIKLIVWFSGFTGRHSETGSNGNEEREPGRKIKLLLVGYNGARNTGADVRVIEIVKQIISLFGEDNVEMTVVTMDVESLHGYFPDSVNMLKLSPIYLLPICRACSRNDAVIICEGSTLKSTFANALAMLYCESAGIAKRQHKPCIAYGTEIGTMEPWLEKMAVELCDETYFITRTEASLERLQKMGLKGHAGTDTAWTFDGEREKAWAEAQLRENGWDGKQPVIGAAVIDPFCWPVKASMWKWLKAGITGNREDQYKMWYFFSRSKQRKQNFERYLSSVAAAVEKYAAEHNCFVAAIGMEALDLDAVNTLTQRLHVPCCSFCSTDNNAFRMAGVLSCLSGLVTSRYHAAVLSMQWGMPIVSISMDERLDELMEEVGMERTFVLRTDDPQLEEHIYDGLNKGAAQREEIRSRIAGSNIAYRQKLDEMGEFLKDFLDR